MITPEWPTLSGALHCEIYPDGARRLGHASSGWHLSTGMAWHGMAWYSV